MCTMEMQLKDLRGIGKKMLEDFEQLGIRSVDDLKSRDARRLYERICILTGTVQDPCVLDTYRCAIEQARNPDLPREQRDWWYWSRLRKNHKAGAVNLRDPSTREHRENPGKMAGFGPNGRWSGAVSSATENPKAVGNALLAPIPGSGPVNLAFVCSYKRIFGWETGIRTTIRSSRGWIIPLDDLPAGGGPF
jgi:hypothetical protein